MANPIPISGRRIYYSRDDDVEFFFFPFPDAPGASVCLGMRYFCPLPP